MLGAELIKIKADINSAEKIFKRAIEVLEADQPNPNEECEYCKYRHM